MKSESVGALGKSSDAAVGACVVAAFFTCGLSLLLIPLLSLIGDTSYKCPQCGYTVTK